MRFRKKAKPIVLLIAYSAVSALLFAIELNAFDRTHSTSLGHQVLHVPAEFLPLSLPVRQDVLLQCDRALSPSEALTKTGQELIEIANRCKSISQSILKTSPTHGFGFLVLAKAQLQLGQPDRAITSLARSAEFSPFEGWLIKRRLVIAFDLQLSGHQVASDIRALLTIQSGAEFLVRHYIRRDETRLAIVDGLQSATLHHQNRFMNLLRKSQALL